MENLNSSLKVDHPDLARMISVDVETSGPNPAEFAMLAIGACTLAEPREHFYIELQPDKPNQDASAMQVHGLDWEKHVTKGISPGEALLRFEEWLKAHTPEGQSPLFVGFNAPFDWMFLCDYFHRYLGRNPFGHSALDIKSFFMGLKRTTWQKTNMQSLSRKKLRHQAMTDACDQADILLDLLQQQQNMPSNGGTDG